MPVTIKNGTLPHILFCNFNFGNLKIATSYMRIHVPVALKSQYLFVVGAAPSPPTQNVIPLLLLCFPNVPSFTGIVLFVRMRARRNHCYWPLVHTNSKVGAYCSKSPHQIFRGGYFRCRKMWTVVNGSVVLGIRLDLYGIYMLEPRNQVDHRHILRPCHSHDGDINGLVQDCSDPIANALELIHTWTKPPMLHGVPLQ